MTATTINQQVYEPLVRQYMFENPALLAVFQGGVRMDAMGKVYASAITASSATSPTETVTLGGTSTSTTIALEKVVKYATVLSLDPAEVESLDVTAPGNLEQWAMDGGGVLVQTFQNAVIAKLVAAGITTTSALTSGQEQFLATSAAQQLDNENKLGARISKIAAQGQLTRADINLIFDYTAWENFTNGKSLILPSSPQQSRINEDGEYPVFKGCRVWVVADNVSTGDNVTGGAAFGGSANSAVQCFIVGKRGYSIHWSPPKVVSNLTTGGLNGQGMWNDGYHKLVIESHMHHGVRLIGQLGTVTNKTS